MERGISDLRSPGEALASSRTKDRKVSRKIGSDDWINFGRASRGP
jgi:hypothetical protein